MLSDPAGRQPENSMNTTDSVDGRHGRTETHEVRVWWEVVVEGRVWNTRNEADAREIARRASEIGTEYELRRVEAVSRTETVTKVEVLSPIEKLSDGSPTKTW